MKTLKEYIKESHGVIDNENSWSKLSEYVVSKTNTIKDSIFTIDDNKLLPPWMHSITVELNSKTPNALASYNDNKSKIIDNKLSCWISIFGKNIKQNIIEHEIQHAFDDWISRTKRGLSNVLTDKYCIGTGYEYEEKSVYPIYGDPKSVDCDMIFQLFKQCTYFFEPTEINAFSREFDLYLKNKLKSNEECDWEKMMDDDLNDTGLGPIFWVKVLKDLIKNSNKFIEDNDHVDWAYIKRGLHDHFSKDYLGKNIIGTSDKDTVIKTAQYILDRQAKKAITKFEKILANYRMQGLVINNFSKIS